MIRAIASWKLAPLFAIQPIASWKLAPLLRFGHELGAGSGSRFEGPAGEETDGFWASGEMEGDAGADSFAAFDFDFAAVLADDAADDEEAEAGAAFLGGEERLEDVAHVLGGDSGSCVADGDGRFVFIEIAAKSDRSAGRGGLGGVADEVVDRLFDLPAINPHEGKVLAQFEFETNPTVLDFRFEESDRLADQLIEVRGFEFRKARPDGGEELRNDEVEPFDFGRG